MSDEIDRNGRGGPEASARRRAVPGAPRRVPGRRERSCRLREMEMPHLTTALNASLQDPAGKRELVRGHRWRAGKGQKGSGAFTRAMK